MNLRLHVFGGDRAYIEGLVAEARAAYDCALRGGIKVFGNHVGSWKMLDVRTRRPKASLVMAEGVFEHLERDLRTFLASADRYRTLGTPWKRGYLLHGEPGNGKSSLIFTLASALDADIYYLSLTSSRLDDEDLVHYLAQVPHGAFVVIEEIDVVTRTRAEESDDSPPTRVTLAGLLNALDGILALEGRIVFMTTNHLERLDPALIRPGRADVHVQVGNATKDQALRLFAAFYPEATPAEARRFEERIPAGVFSMAELQEHFLRHAGDPAGAMADIAARLPACAVAS